MRNVRRRRAQQGGRRIGGRGARRQAAGREGDQRGAAPNPLVHDGSLRDSLQRHAVQSGALRALHLLGVEAEQLGGEGHREGSLAVRFEGNASVIQIHRGRLSHRAARKQQCRYRKVEKRLLPAVENEEQISREGLQNLEDSETRDASYRNDKSVLNRCDVLDVRSIPNRIEYEVPRVLLL